jgi:hypothetical protein
MTFPKLSFNSEPDTFTKYQSSRKINIMDNGQRGRFREHE